MVAALCGVGRGRGEPEAPAQEVASELIESAFLSDEPSVIRAAAFVTGRCDPEPSRDIAGLVELVKDLVASSDLHALHSGALPYVEAAMAIALQGDAPAGHDALLPLVGGAVPSTMADWLAAFYLAQMGDPAGWPALVGMLEGKDGFTRLMAARHLVGFLPYDQQTVGERKVDVLHRLGERLDDDDPLVSLEIPALLAEAGGIQILDVLTSAVTKARHADTRKAARHVLEDLAADQPAE